MEHIATSSENLFRRVWDTERSKYEVRDVEVDGKSYLYHIPTSSVISPDGTIARLVSGIRSGRVSSLDDFTREDFDGARQLIALNSIRRPQLDDKQLSITHLAISPTLSCNLSCTYCYNFQESPEAKVRATPRIDKIAITKILHTLSDLPIGARVNLAFIGGEPLLYPALLNKLARFSRSIARRHQRALTLMVTTNGLSLGRASIKRVITRNDIRVSISLDGPPQWHDETRRLLNGKGSFEVIRRNIDEFFSYYSHPIRAARATYRLLPGRLLETYRYLRDMGFNDISTGSHEFESGDLNDLDIASLLNEIDELAVEIERDFISGKIIRHAWFTEVISNLQLGRVKDVICGATRNHVAFDVFGRMQACHRYLGNEDYELTATDINGPAKSELLTQIRSPGKTGYCTKCWARSLCGGECFHVGKEIHKQEDHARRQRFLCDYKRRKYEAAMRIFIRLAEKHPEVLNRIVNPSIA